MRCDFGISIHKALASLDRLTGNSLFVRCNFNPQGSREPRRCSFALSLTGQGFQSTRLSRASTEEYKIHRRERLFQSTRLSQASTIILLFLPLHSMYFNPQGSREPRLEKHHIFGGANRFQYTRLSRASTRIPCNFPVSISISIHKALASLDHRWILSLRIATIFQSTRLSRASTAFSSKCPFSS